MDFILGVGVAVLLLAALIAWSAWIYRLDRNTFVESFDARMNAAEAWDEGAVAGWADAGRWTDGTPYTGDTPNPYREGSK